MISGLRREGVQALGVLRRGRMPRWLIQNKCPGSYIIQDELMGIFDLGGKRFPKSIGESIVVQTELSLGLVQWVVFFFSSAEDKHMTLCVLSRCFTTEPHPSATMKDARHHHSSMADSVA